MIKPTAHAFIDYPLPFENYLFFVVDDYVLRWFGTVARMPFLYCIGAPHFQQFNALIGM
jgi:hypothetical protein